LRQTYDLDILWRAFPLHPETPLEGRTLEDLFRGRPIDIPDMMARLKAVSLEEGLPFGDRGMTYNSRLAQELGKWAESRGRGDQFHDRAFRAYFADGKNIADHDVLMELAVSAGLPEADAEAALRERAFKQAVDADWSLSRDMGVTAVPTFILGDQRVVGAQPYEVMARLVDVMGVPRRA
jgi:predicted DsbA family dithiol-disulfide isomerase